MKPIEECDRGGILLVSDGEKIAIVNADRYGIDGKFEDLLTKDGKGVIDWQPTLWTPWPGTMSCLADALHESWFLPQENPSEPSL